MAANPFTPSAPPARLIGRDSELSDICAQVRNHGHFALSGIPGCGKTSLLRALLDTKIWLPDGAKPADGIAVYVDLANIQPFAPLEFWAAIRDELAASLHPNDPLRQAAAVAEPSPQGAQAMLQAVRNGGRRAVLLLDGYDSAVRTNDSYSASAMSSHLFDVRRLAQAKCFAAVTATYRRLDELGPSPEKLAAGGSLWYNQYLFHPVRDLSPADCNRFYDQMASYAPPVDWRRALRELCGGNVALHQHAGKILYDSAVRGSLPTMADFWERLESATRHYYRNWWNWASPKEQLLMMLVAVSKAQNRLDLGRDFEVSDLPVVFSHNDRELRELTERGLVNRESGNRFSFHSSMMEWWVLREIASAAAASGFDDRSKELLGLSKGQLKSINAALSRVWKHKDAVQSAVVWFAKVLATGKP